MMMIAALTVAAVSAMAQSDKSPVDAYFTTSEMPDMLKWCPAPPDTASSAFAYDITQYFWGKKMRNCKERADIAIRDAVYGLDCIIREFSEPFGLQSDQRVYYRNCHLPQALLHAQAPIHALQRGNALSG